MTEEDQTYLKVIEEVMRESQIGEVETSSLEGVQCIFLWYQLMPGTPKMAIQMSVTRGLLIVSGLLGMKISESGATEATLCEMALRVYNEGAVFYGRIEVNDDYINYRLFQHLPPVIACRAVIANALLSARVDIRRYIAAVGQRMLLEQASTELSH